MIVTRMRPVLAFVGRVFSSPVFAGPVFSSPAFAGRRRSAQAAAAADIMAA